MTFPYILMLVMTWFLYNGTRLNISYSLTADVYYRFSNSKSSTMWTNKLDLVYTDFSRTVDSMDHKMSLGKFYTFWFNLDLLQILYSQLITRCSYISNTLNIIHLPEWRRDLTLGLFCLFCSLVICYIIFVWTMFEFADNLNNFS